MSVISSNFTWKYMETCAWCAWDCLHCLIEQTSAGREPHPLLTVLHPVMSVCTTVEPEPPHTAGTVLRPKHKRLYSHCYDLRVTVPPGCNCRSRSGNHSHTTRVGNSGTLKQLWTVPSQPGTAVLTSSEHISFLYLLKSHVSMLAGVPQGPRELSEPCGHCGRSPCKPLD